VIFAALVAIFFMQMFRWKGVIIAMIILPLLFLSAYYSSITFKVYVSAIVTDIQAYRQHNEISSVGERYNFSKNSLELIAKRPLLGYGTGSFKYAYTTLKPTPVTLTNNPHNEYMHIGVQFGVLGILLLCFMFGFQFWQSRYLPQDMRFLAQAIILAIAIGSLANSWLLDSVEGNLYVYFIALCFAVKKH